MSINVTRNTQEDGNQFPIRVEIHQQVNQVFTIKAAIELRRKLETAISDYQVDEALKGEG